MAVDDASWLVFTRLCPGEHGSSACQALLQALCYYQWTGHPLPAAHDRQWLLLPLLNVPALMHSSGLRYIHTKPVHCAPTVRPGSSLRWPCTSGSGPVAMTDPGLEACTCLADCITTKGTGRTPASTTNRRFAVSYFH